ncbi:MAG: ferredoxin family protein [Chloroflexota bacterium]|nr:MAG: ferredoxin family protein [Chloroflexota bacterium]
MRGTIVIDENRCKGCQLCTYVCPKHLIGMAETFTPRGYQPARLFDPHGDCTGCLLCAVICPDVAITVYRTPRENRQDRAVATHPQTAELGSESHTLSRAIDEMERVQ